MSAGASTAEVTQSDDLKELQKTRDRLKKELMQIERQIFDLEGSYLEETATTGNVLVGWDVVLKEGFEPSRQKREVHKKVTKEDRLFTLSSVTAPSSSGRRSTAVALAPLGGMMGRGEAGEMLARGEPSGQPSMVDMAFVKHEGPGAPALHVPKKRGRPVKADKGLKGDDRGEGKQRKKLKMLMTTTTT